MNDRDMNEITRRLDQMESRLMSRIDEAKRDITARQDRTNGHVGEALDRTSKLEAFTTDLRHELDRTRNRVHDLAESIMTWLHELGQHDKAKSLEATDDNRNWLWRDTRWMIYIISSAVIGTIAFLRLIGWGPS